MELLFNLLGGIEISISMADTRLWPSERHNRGLMYCRQYGTVYRCVYIYISSWVLGHSIGNYTAVMRSKCLIMYFGMSI